LTEDRQGGKAGDARDLAEQAEIKRGQENYGVDRYQDRNRDEESEEKFKRRPRVFEGLAIDLGIRPEESPYIGCEPETVDAEGEHQQHRAPDEQPPIGSALPKEPHAAARGDPTCIEAHLRAGIMAGGTLRNVGSATADFTGAAGDFRRPGPVGRHCGDRVPVAACMSGVAPWRGSHRAGESLSL